MPLSPWGYWPQMSKMENLRDFSDFQPSAPYALFGISPSRAAQSLATQGFAVFGKKSENLQPFWLSKRFSTLAVYHPMKILSNQIKNEQQASDCLLLITMQVSIVHITESLHDLFIAEFAARLAEVLHHIVLCLRRSVLIASQLHELSFPIRNNGLNDGAAILDDGSRFFHVRLCDIFLPLLMREDGQILVKDFPRMPVHLVFDMIPAERLLNLKQVGTQAPFNPVAMQFAEALEEYKERKLQREARLITLTCFHQEIELLMCIFFSAKVNGSIFISELSS